MSDDNIYKDLGNDNIREEIKKIKKIKKENPNIENEISKTKKLLLKDISKKDKKSGNWFLIILQKVLDTHAKNVSFEYFREKYNTSVKDIIAKKVIYSACNYSIMTGVVLGAGGGILGIPSAIPATFGEIATLTYFQLKMIYDLSLIYDKPIDLDDPEEAYKILAIALDIKSTELLNGGIEIGMKNAGKFAVEKTGRRVVLNPIQRLLSVIGVQITQRSIKNFLSKAIPLIGIGLGGVVCSILDYKSTKRVANNSLSIYRTPKLMVELFENNNMIPANDEESFDTLIKGCMIIANADDVVDINKTILIDHIYQSRSLNNNYKERIKIIDKEFFEPYKKIENLEIKKTILFTLEMIAASDRKISKKELEILCKVSAQLGIDKKELEEEMKNLINDLIFI